MSNTATPTVGGEAAVGTFDYLLPSLGADMDEGRVIEWRVAIGDTVHRGDLMAVVETEKSDIDIEIWHDGTVEAFLVSIGELIPVGTPIVRLRGSGGGSEPIVTAPTPAAAPTTTPAAPRLRRVHGHRSLRPLGTVTACSRRRWLVASAPSGGSTSPRSPGPDRAGPSSKPTSGGRRSSRPPNRRVGAHRQRCARSSPNG